MFSTKTRAGAINTPIRLVVLEDHQVVGDGVAAALEAIGSFECERVVTTLDELRDYLAGRGTTEPLDVIVADIDLGNGVFAFAVPSEAARIGTRVVYLSSHTESWIVKSAVESGAAGLVHKLEPTEHLAEAIRRAARGDSTFSLEDLALARSTPKAPTSRECQVLTAIAHGLGNKEIAARLMIEERTVETHIQRLLDRYGRANRTDLAVHALRQGWVDVSD